MVRFNKTILSTILFILLASFQQVLFGQTINGKVVDSKQQPIEGVTIVLQARDSTYISASISNVDGVFILNNQPQEYYLIVQHLLYNTKQILGSGKDVGVIQLESKDYALDGIVVKAEQSFVKLENGRLGYNLSALAGSGVVDNVYEALTKLPGVQQTNGTFTLAGAGHLTVILNGKPTTMDAKQLETLLRNTPVNRVEKAEVMYSAPPEYHIRGAVINVVLKRSNDYSFNGEISADYKNQYFNSGGINGNFRLSTPKVAFDLMYSAGSVNEMEYMDIYSKHTLKGYIYEINQNNQISSKYLDHNLRGAFEYNISDKSNVNISYTGNFNPNQHNKSQTAGNYQDSNTDKYIDTRMHNVSLQYHSKFGLDIGGDYTYYCSDSKQDLHVNYKEGNKISMSLLGGQTINRYSIYVDQNHKLDKGWNLGYGASYKFAYDSDFQIYTQVVGDIKAENINSNIKEHSANFYASVGKSYQTGTSFSISATGEFYTIGSYHKWAIYPQATFSYIKTPKHMFQFSLSTDKTYPSYWDMQSSVSYIDGYTELWGTPGLRPMITYNLNGNYIFNKKYILGVVFMHTTDYFMQAAYQSTDRLALIYKNTNWNYMQLWGINAVLPFKVGGWLDSRLTLQCMQMHQRCDNFFDVPFNRKKWFFNGSLDNTFKVYKNLAFELNANVLTPTIQGTFDIKSVFNLNAGMKFNFAKNKITLSARCSDILGTGTPNVNIRFKGQYLDMNNAFYSRAFRVHFIYRFGGYKTKENKQVDISRFGH